MDMLNNLALGFETALSFSNLLYALLGCILGTLIGVLPGLGPVTTMAMLLPSVYALDTVPALIMMAGIYYGAQYGGSTTAILINVPGEATSVMTAIDGYQMARKGRAGTALAVAALSSFLAGCVGTLVIAGLAPPLTRLGMMFSPVEYFSLMVLGLLGAVALSSGSVLKAVGMTILGLLLAQVGTDVITGTQRFTFDMIELTDGLSFIAIAMGIYGLSEIVSNLGRSADQRDMLTGQVGGLRPSREDLARAMPAAARGTLIGSLLGVLPGGGALLSSFAAYSIEKKLAGRHGNFGQGDVRGVAAPEAANNAGAQTAFIPMLTMGIPPNPVLAVMIGAMMIKGIQPGPQVIGNNPDLFWGLIASMWIGNLILVILNLPLIGIWVRLLTIPYRVLFPAILAFCCIGLYTVNNNSVDVYLGAVFGLIGYVFFKLRCEPAPLVLGFILGPMLEENLRRSLLLSQGDWTVFAQRPISAGLLLAAVVLVAATALPRVRRQREATFLEA